LHAHMWHGMALNILYDVHPQLFVSGRWFQVRRNRSKVASIDAIINRHHAHACSSSSRCNVRERAKCQCMDTSECHSDVESTSWIGRVLVRCWSWFVAHAGFPWKVPVTPARSWLMQIMLYDVTLGRARPGFARPRDSHGDEGLP
jgi:hypothetical protein